MRGSLLPLQAGWTAADPMVLKMLGAESCAVKFHGLQDMWTETDTAARPFEQWRLEFGANIFAFCFGLQPVGAQRQLDKQPC